MHVHLVQLDIEWENPAANRDRARRLIESAAIVAGDLVLLPEMFDTGFSFNTARTADTSGESGRFLAALAKGTGAFVVGGVTVIDERGRARNRAVVSSPDGIAVASYDKHYLFPLGSPSEAGSLTPGTEVATFAWAGPPSSGGGEGLRVCPLICYDLRFPELFQEGLKRGAEAFAVIANWPVDRAAHWRGLLIARAIENQAFVFGVNRVGRDPKLNYAGGSLAVDPLGRVLAEGDDGEGVLSVPIDARVLTDWRGRFPAWRERLG